ncbi:hypothetical protein D9613_001865 [Agrocybe pediades]|uniref:Peroxisomal membrane protein PEX14 n=1 Tax=Agrocybe pediades TaxID=84607 RepID=A0A8H4R5I9_9AGAR|nr:hypothetical protein D9613_001865 [Agrocybe pediades]
MSTPDRQELIRNAVAFLADPKSQASPVTQRIQFLEAKGLTPPEIDVALKQAALVTTGPVNQTAPTPYSVNYYTAARPPPPPPHRWDWRDYFITAVVSGAVTYSAVTLFKKYLLPHLQPPTSTAYEEDRDALTAQFDAAEALLKEIQAETAAVKTAVEEQREKIDQTTEDVRAVVVEMREGEAKTRDEMREIREEVNNIREMLPKMIEKNKESQNQSLAELQQELKSLKALLLSRGPTVPPSTPASPLPLLGRPSIPAWQLASSPQPSSTSNADSSTTPFSSNINGKGKEVDKGTETQLRNAVEQLAQQPIRALDGSSTDNSHADASGSRSQSLDLQAARSASPLSSSQLAESAISSLRKSFVSQRANSFSGSPSKAPSPSTQQEPSAAPAPARPKSKLEERLRQATKVALSESHSPSPSPPARSSRVASPSPMGRNRTRPIEESPADKVLPASNPAEPPASPEHELSSKSNEGAVAGASSSSEVKQEQDIPSAAPPASVSEPAEGVKEADEDISNNTQDVAVASAQSANEEESREAEQPPSHLLDTASHLPVDAIVSETPAHVEEAKNQSVDVVEPTPESVLVPVPSSNDTPVKQGEDVVMDISSTPPEVSDSQKEEAAHGTGTPVATAAKDGASTQEEGNARTLSTHETSLDPVEPESASSTEGRTTSSSPTTETPDEKVLTTELSPAGEEEASSLHLDRQPSELDVAPTAASGSEPATQPSEGKQESVPSSTKITTSSNDQNVEVENLQSRLRQIEQRFSDVSTSFKRLQAEKLAADNVLKEISPLESISDANALRDFLTNLHTKDQARPHHPIVYQEEIKRLNQKLELQEDRSEEVRETHRLESQSSREEVRKLKTQLDETEALFQAAQRATTHAEEAVEKQKDDFTKVQKELETARNTAKEEEEKRVKAISLLKTVRQKLVKAEKDKDDATKELQVLKEREKGEKIREQADKQNYQQEIDALTASHEKAIGNLRSQFNKDLSSTKERYEQEISLVRGQFELEIASLKSTHSVELGAKISQITTLENSLNNVTRDKNAFFDQLQLRQAEVESAQAHLESLQHQNSELQFQLREANDRLALLKEEYAELMREQETRSRDPVTSADEVARMISATEAKYEAKLADMRRSISILEKERSEGEADWSRKLKEKVKDLEDLKKVLGTATRSREADENVVNELKGQLAEARDANRNLEQQVSQLPALREQLQDLQRAFKEQENELNVKTALFEKHVEESKAREAQLKQSNKTIREELRKVQSSAALLERQRNPGVGYWTTRASENGATESRASLDSPSRTSSPAPSTATSTKNTEEEVNLEYLRNVILQFLEHKEMRPNLVKVLSIILHFTPQETRRLIAKV